MISDIRQWKQQALILLQQDRRVEARALYEAICRNHGDDVESLFMLGRLYGHNGQFDQASRCFCKCLDVAPDHFMARCALGIAYKAMGDYAAAAESLQMALQQQPGNSDVLLEYSNVLLDDERLDEAEEVLLRILNLRADCGDALHGLGVVNQRRNKHTAAAEYYQQALQCKPDSAVTHVNLGFVMQRLGRVDEASRHYLAATELDPGYAEAFKLLGDTYTSQCRTGEALAAYDAALEISPDYLEANVGKVMLQERTNNIDEAYRLLQPLIDSAPPVPGIGLAFAQLSRYVNRDEEAVDYLERLLDTPLAADVEMQIHFALGKLLDSRKRYREAFRHYRKGNRLINAKYDPEGQERRFDRIISAYDRNFMRSCPISVNISELPVFIIGMPRSGTTLVESVLTSHPAIHGAGELLNIMKQAEQLNVTADAASGYPECIRRLGRQELNTLSEEYIAGISALSPTADRVIDKMPHNFLYLGLIAMELPNARVIHCVRDPVDTCLSIYFQSFSDAHPYAADLRYIAHYYRQYQRLMRHWYDVLDLRMLEIRYEEIIDNLESESRKMLDFIGLDWSRRCLDFHEAHRPVDTISYDQVRRPLYSDSVSRWKNYAEEIQPLLSMFDAASRYSLDRTL